MNYIVWLTWAPSPVFFEKRTDAQIHYNNLRAALKNPEHAQIRKLTEV
jgi:hypothetical protein